MKNKALAIAVGIFFSVSIASAGVFHGTFGDSTGGNITGASGVGGGVGSVDNTILRSDGTGGTTIQASPLVCTDAGAVTGVASIGTANWFLGQDSTNTGHSVIASDDFSIKEAVGGEAVLFIERTANRVYIDSGTPGSDSGGLEIGPEDTYQSGFKFQINSQDASGIQGMFTNASDTAAASGTLGFRRYRGTLASRTIVQSGDRLGRFAFQGLGDVNASSSGAEIIAEVDNTPGTGNMPGRLIFLTTADGATTSTEHMRIDRFGNVTVTSTAPTTRLTDTTSTEDDAQWSMNANALTLGFDTNDDANYDITSMVIDSSNGNVALSANLDVKGANITNSIGSMNLTASTGGNVSISPIGTGHALVNIDGNSFLGIGTSSPTQAIHVVQDAAYTVELDEYLTGTGSQQIQFARARGSAASPSSLSGASGGDRVGFLSFLAHDGVNFEQVATMGVYMDGTVSSDVVPSKFVFSTVLAGTKTLAPALTIENDGDLLVAGCVTYDDGSAGSCLSDARLKNILGAAPDALDKLRSLAVTRYIWKDNTSEAQHAKGEQVGLIAQQVQSVAPEMIDHRGDTLRVRYGKLPMMMLVALQELADRLDALWESDDDLNSRVAELEARLNAMEVVNAHN